MPTTRPSENAGLADIALSGLSGRQYAAQMIPLRSLGDIADGVVVLMTGASGPISAVLAIAEGDRSLNLARIRQEAARRDCPYVLHLPIMQAHGPWGRATALADLRLGCFGHLGSDRAHVEDGGDLGWAN